MIIRFQPHAPAARHDGGGLRLGDEHRAVVPFQRHERVAMRWLSLYMDERTLERAGGFKRLSADLARLADGLAVALEARILQTREAAE